MFCCQHSPADVLEIFDALSVAPSCEVENCKREAYWISFDEFKKLKAKQPPEDEARKKSEYE